MPDTDTDTTTTDTSSGSLTRDVYVTSDNIKGSSKDKAMMETVCNKINSSGYTAHNMGIGPNKHCTVVKSAPDYTYVVNIYGGACATTLKEMGSSYFKNWQQHKKIVVAFLAPALDIRTVSYLNVAHDDNTGATSGLDDPYNYVIGLGVGFAYGNDNDDLAEQIVNALNGTSGGTSSSIEIVEGFIESGRGVSPQFWNKENYHDYQEIVFTKFDVTEEFPRQTSATLTTPVNIDLTTGRVACLITGECNSFSGIIIDKKYDATKKLYDYQLHGFMERIMANQINLVANGGKTTYDWIKEVLADLSVPDTGLLPIDDYDTAVSKELLEEMEEDMDLPETSEQLTSDSDTDTSNAPQYNTDSNENTDTGLDYNELNPFKKKPAGIYDKQTISEWIRTLIYDYGINVEFYGDLNGVPQFEIIDFEKWKQTGWYISPDLGFDADYEYEFDITDVVTQVAVKNISATNGTGEIYTSEELIGINLADFVGRMGVVVDNPSGSSTQSTGDSEDDTTGDVFQDSTGKIYDKNDVLTTNGYPSCEKCKEKNGGSMPTIKKYTKYWYNYCPGCNRRGYLKSTSTGDGTTYCSGGDCGLEFCQFCGYERKSQKLQLTELTYTKKSSNSESSSSSTDSSSS